MVPEEEKALLPGRDELDTPENDEAAREVMAYLLAGAALFMAVYSCFY
jgi:hypothetical protein